jgi:hypothetical protein
VPFREKKATASHRKSLPRPKADRQAARQARPFVRAIHGAPVCLRVWISLYSIRADRYKSKMAKSARALASSASPPPVAYGRAMKGEGALCVTCLARKTCRSIRLRSRREAAAPQCERLAAGWYLIACFDCRIDARQRELSVTCSRTSRQRAASIRLRPTAADNTVAARLSLCRLPLWRRRALVTGSLLSPVSHRTTLSSSHSAPRGPGSQRHRENSLIASSCRPFDTVAPGQHTMNPTSLTMTRRHQDRCTAKAVQEQ